MCHVLYICYYISINFANINFTFHMNTIIFKYQEFFYAPILSYYFIQFYLNNYLADRFCGYYYMMRYNSWYDSTPA